MLIRLCIKRWNIIILSERVLYTVYIVYSTARESSDCSIIGIILPARRDDEVFPTNTAALLPSE